MKYAVGFSGLGFGSTVRGILIDVSEVTEDSQENAKRAEFQALEASANLWAPDVKASVNYVIPIYLEA